MPDEKPDTLETSSELVAEMIERYESRPTKRNFLWYGDPGTGKTSALRTVRTPVQIDFFDPGGVRTDMLQEAIAKHDIIPDDWSRVRVDPFRKWEEAFMKRHKAGFYKHIATYCLDSITAWTDAIMSAIVKSPRGEKASPRTYGVPALDDYQVLNALVEKYLRIFFALPCDVIVTGHIARTRDSLTGGILSALLVPGEKLKDKPFPMFEEIYLAHTVESEKGLKYLFQLRNDGIYRARTSMGGEKLAGRQPQNLREIHKRAGYSYEDLPPFKL